MLKFSTIIKYYLLSFLLIDAFSGFIRIYLGITNPLFNIGYWIRGPILVMFFFYYIYQIKQKTIFFDELLVIILFFYFCFNTLFNYLIQPSSRVLVENCPYFLRQQFLFFLFVFIKNRMVIDKFLTSKIIQYNFIILVISLSIGYLFGFGLESYRFSGTSKGMFQGGNAVSILNLIFFAYFILDGALRKKIVPVAFTIFNGFVIASKSIFGFIIPIYFALRRRALSVNKLILYNIFIFSFIFSFSYLSERAVDIYETRFGLNIKKSIAAAEKVGGLYNNSSLNKISSILFRRFASLNEQMEESVSNINTFVIGKGIAGQNIFWEKRGEFWFKNASMDFFDFFFKYGLIGTIIFIIVLLRNIIPAIKKSITRDKIVILLFFSYSFFGGHVIDSATSGSLFYYFLAKIKS